MHRIHEDDLADDLVAAAAGANLRLRRWLWRTADRGGPEVSIGAAKVIRSPSLVGGSTTKPMCAPR